MSARPSAALVLLAVLTACRAAAAAAAPAGKGRGRAEVEPAAVSEQITIRGKGGAGPALQPPPAAPGPAVIDEVERSLRLSREDIPESEPMARVPGAPRRLAAPFPEPPFLVFSARSYPHRHDRWVFEVFSGEKRVWKAEAAGPLEDAVSWDGYDESGRFVARVGETYSFRFTGALGDDESSVASEPMALESMLFREALGEIRLEAANSVLFADGGADLLDEAGPFLEEMAGRMRRLNPRNKPYRLVLHQAEPSSRLAEARAAALSRHFSKALLANPELISVERRSIGERGDCAAAVLPPEEGGLVVQ